MSKDQKDCLLGNNPDEGDNDDVNSAAFLLDNLNVSGRCKSLSGVSER